MWFIAVPMAETIAFQSPADNPECSKPDWSAEENCPLCQNLWLLLKSSQRGFICYKSGFRNSVFLQILQKRYDVLNLTEIQNRDDNYILTLV